MKKIFVLDTNVLITNPKCIIESFDEHDVVLPLTVIEELDGLKNKEEVGYYAREALRNIDKVRQDSIDIANGVKRNEAGGILRIVTIRNRLEELGESTNILSDSVPDNRIVLTALLMKLENPEQVVSLISNDCNARVKASYLKVPAQRYLDSVVPEEYLTYTGMRTVEMPLSFFGEIKDGSFEPYKDDRNSHVDIIDIPQQEMEICENEFVLLEPNKKEIKEAGVTKKVLKTIKSVYRRRGFILEFRELTDTLYGNVRGKNLEQSALIDVLCDNDIKVVTVRGSAGTGKTICTLAHAIKEVKDGVYDSIVFLKPTITAHEEIGFLKGDMIEKLRPFLGSYIDNLNVLKKMETVQSKSTNNDDFDTMVKEGVIEVEHIGFLRGRSISESIIILDEAQNLSKSVAKTIVSRVGMGSKIIILGDTSQIDAKHLTREDNALSHIIKNLRGESVYAHITLEKCERSEVSRLAGARL